MWTTSARRKSLSELWKSATLRNTETHLGPHMWCRQKHRVCLRLRRLAFTLRCLSCASCSRLPRLTSALRCFNSSSVCRRTRRKLVWCSFGVVLVSGGPSTCLLARHAAILCSLTCFSEACFHGCPHFQGATEVYATESITHKCKVRHSSVCCFHGDGYVDITAKWKLVNRS